MLVGANTDPNFTANRAQSFAGGAQYVAHKLGMRDKRNIPYTTETEWNVWSEQNRLNDEIEKVRVKNEISKARFRGGSAPPMYALAEENL